MKATHSDDAFDRTSAVVAGVTLELRKGDITTQDDIEAIVNAANRMLETGGGVAGAIHSAGGPGLAAEARSFAPISPGEAVITGAHDLPNTHVIHCLGPIYGSDRPEAALLAACYRNALAHAEERGIRSIAFPAISTGIFGYPVEEASRVALQAVIDEIPRLKSVRLIRFVFFDQDALTTNIQTLASLLG
jgi:O-acetyl-ADP-ribose deacetylase